jgi:AcrR family transcriptional regulator
MARPPRREREIERIREDILHAAARAFAEKGFHAATMQDIAREAGYTPASLYTYFESKDRIFAALFEAVARESKATFEEPVPAGLTLRQRLELVVYRQYRIFDRHRDAFTVFFSGLNDGRPIACPHEGQRPAGFFVMLRHLTHFLREAGWETEYPGTPVEDAALVLAGIHNSFFISWVAANDDSHLSDRAADVVDYFFHGVSGRERSPRKKASRA